MTSTEGPEGGGVSYGLRRDPDLDFRYPGLISFRVRYLFSFFFLVFRFDLPGPTQPQNQSFPGQKRFNSLGATSALAPTHHVPTHTRPEHYQYQRSVSVGSTALLNQAHSQQSHSQPLQYAHLPGASAPYVTLTRLSTYQQPASATQVPPRSPPHQQIQVQQTRAQHVPQAQRSSSTSPHNFSAAPVLWLSTRTLPPPSPTPSASRRHPTEFKRSQSVMGCACQQRHPPRCARVDAGAGTDADTALARADAWTPTAGGLLAPPGVGVGPGWDTKDKEGSIAVRAMHSVRSMARLWDGDKKEQNRKKENGKWKGKNGSPSDEARREARRAQRAARESTNSSLRPLSVLSSGSSAGSRVSSGSSVRWAEVVDREREKKDAEKKESKERKERERESRRNSEGRKHTPLSDVFPGLSWRSSTAETTTDGHGHGEEDDQLEVDGDFELVSATPMKRPRLHHVSDDILQRAKSRPRGTIEDAAADGVLNLLDAATNDLAQLITHLTSRGCLLRRRLVEGRNPSFKCLHRRTMTPTPEPNPTPLFHPLRLRPPLAIVTGASSVGVDMRAPSSLTFGSRSSSGSIEDPETLRMRGLPPVFTRGHARNRSSLFPDGVAKEQQGKHTVGRI
ncbi:hypothetical protein K438DRAFT_2077372 [Mycena galopus ATCC 62051]|nr:hypothetical protein K438DRAFT_2077372 [Mycena galopus ATCC 62051]